MDQYSSLLILAVLVVLFWLFTARTRRRQRHQVEIRASLQIGSRVMTTSGLIATVVSVDDPESVVLEIAPGVHTTWVRGAVGQVLDDPEDDPQGGPISASDSEPGAATSAAIAEPGPYPGLEPTPGSSPETPGESASGPEVIDVRPPENVRVRNGLGGPSPG